MEWLFARDTVIGVAVAGGIVAVVAMAMKKQPGRVQLARRLDVASYILMGTSMVLFIIAGLRGSNG